MSCGVGYRCTLDPVLLWLWCSLAATALIQPLAWKLPYAAGATLKQNKTKQNKETKKKKKKYVFHDAISSTKNLVASDCDYVKFSSICWLSRPVQRRLMMDESTLEIFQVSKLPGQEDQWNAD